jgi:hypothetical protein
LSEDFRFSQDLGIQSCRYLKEVFNGLPSGENKSETIEVLRRDTALFAKNRCDFPRCAHISPDRVDLNPVASIEDYEFADRR